MPIALLILGFLLVLAGLAFAFNAPGAVKAGGSALKSVSLEGPAWLILVGIGAGVIAFAGWLDHEIRSGTVDKTTETLPTAPPTVPTTVAGDDGTDDPWGDDPFTYGDDNDLDKLWRECDRGIWTSCDDLYLQSPLGSDYEWFGASCGEVIPDPIDYCDVSNQEGVEP